MMVALAILGLLLALGIPAMSNWLMASKAGSATEFYAEGFRMARGQAVKHNSASRIRLTENPNNGQFDWQVDICFPIPATTPCNDSSGSWSTASAIAAGDPEGTAGFKSVARAADALPPRSILKQTLVPPGATDVYYNSLGWVDTASAGRLEQLKLAPAPGHAGAFPASAIAITLAGTASKCDPTVALHDSRRCPP